VGTLDGLWTN
jgi:hypothetical protein